jgi:hypothetical protein
MDTREALDAIPDRTLNRLLLIGVPVVVVALLVLAVTNTHRSQALEMRQWLATVAARDVARVVILPEKPSSLAAGVNLRPTVVTATSAIQALLTAYKQAGSYGPGGGRFSGGWEAQVAFHLRTGQVMYSTVYQNDYASLLFIASQGTSRPSSPSDCLMSQTAGQLIKQLASPAH